MNETELSKRVWNLKDHGLDNNLSWEIDNFLYQFFLNSFIAWRLF